MIFKKSFTITLALAFANTSFLNASWFNVHTIVRYAPLAYTLANTSLNAGAFLYTKTIASAVQKDRWYQERLCRFYPLTIKYIHDELTHAGIDPSKIAIIPSDSRGPASSASIIVFPLASFEQASETLKKEPHSYYWTSSLNGNRAALAHEIGHLKHNDAFICIFFPLIAHAVVHLASAIITPEEKERYLLAQIPIQAVKIISMHTINHGLQIIEEYRADSFFMQRFAHEPLVLLEASRQFSGIHKTIFSDHYKLLTKTLPSCLAPLKKILNYPAYWHLAHLLRNDVHPSHLSRATRFAKAAQQQITPQDLAQTPYAHWENYLEEHAASM